MTRQEDGLLLVYLSNFDMGEGALVILTRSLLRDFTSQDDYFQPLEERTLGAKLKQL